MQAKTEAKLASVCLCDGGVALTIIPEASGFKLHYDIREISLRGEADRDMGLHSAEALAWTGLDGDPGRPLHGRLFHFAQTR